MTMASPLNETIAGPKSHALRTRIGIKPLNPSSRAAATPAFDSDDPGQISGADVAAPHPAKIDSGDPADQEGEGDRARASNRRTGASHARG